MGTPTSAGILLRLDRRLRLEFRRAKIIANAGLVAVRILDEWCSLGCRRI